MPEKTSLPILLFGLFVLLTARRAPGWAVRRPSLILVLVAGLAAAGGLSFHQLPAELMPNAASEIVTVTVNVRGGMAPPDVETLIVRPVEEALGDVPRLRDLLSSAKKDRGVVSLVFEPGTDMRAATAEAHERMERALARLPPEIEKPVIAHFEESDAPVYIGAVTSDRLSPEDIRRVLEERVKDRLLRAPGVANVELGGGRERKILVEADRDRLLAYHIPIHRIVSVLGRRNVALQVGSVEGETRATPFRLVGTLESLEEMKKTVVGRDPSGGTVLLENVAAVRDSHLEAESLSRLNGRIAVSFYVQKESGANTLAVAREAERAFQEAWQDLGPGLRRSLEAVIVSNQALAIRAALAALRGGLLSGVLLIVLVLALFQSALHQTRLLGGAGLALLAGLGLLKAFLPIPAAILDGGLTLLIAAFAVLAILHADLRPALIVGGTIPLSALFCLVLFRLSGISLNVMSLFGLALGIGMLVDNAVVVYENVSEKAARAGGRFAPDDVARAAESMTGPLIGATLTNVVVFAPFLFLSPELRRMYADAGAGVAASLFASLGVSLTWVPLLCAHVSLDPAESKIQGLLARLENGWRRLAPPVRRADAWARSRLKYAPPIRWDKAASLKRLWPVLTAAAAGLWVMGQGGPLLKILFSLAAGLFLGGGLFSLKDHARHWPVLYGRRFQALGAAGLLALAGTGLLGWGLERDFQSAGELEEFVIFVELSSGARLTVADEVVREVERKIQEDPLAAACVKTLVSRVEGWSSKIYVTLLPRRERPLSTEEVIARLRERLQDAGRYKDDNAFVHFSGARTGQEMTIHLLGPDPAVLEELAQRAAAGLERVPGLQDVKLHHRPGRPEVVARVDPDKARRHGLSAEAAVETAHALLRGLRATTWRDRGRQTEVVVRLRPEDRESLPTVLQVPLLTRPGEQLHLGQVADFEMSKMPNEIHRRNKERLITVSALRRGLSLGRAAEEIQKVLDNMSFPLDYHAELGGDYQAAAEGLRQLAWGVGVMVFLVYLVLVVLFESLAEPLLIMTTVPLCAIGAALGLILLGLPLSTGVLVGLMILGGIVVNNAILLLERFNEFGADGRPLAERLGQAARDRLRPIFLTAGTNLLGFLPLMLDVSEAGALWRPLAATMVFGLLASTVLTLWVVPCATCLLLQDIPEGWKKLRRRLRGEGPPRSTLAKILMRG